MLNTDGNQMSYIVCKVAITIHQDISQEVHQAAAIPIKNGQFYLNDCHEINW